MDLLNKGLKFGIRDVRVPVDKVIASIKTNIKKKLKIVRGLRAESSAVAQQILDNAHSIVV